MAWLMFFFCIDFKGVIVVGSFWNFPRPWSCWIPALQEDLSLMSLGANLVFERIEPKVVMLPSEYPEYTMTRVVAVSNILWNVHPEILGKMIPNFDEHIVQMGWLKPPTR